MNPIPTDISAPRAALVAVLIVSVGFGAMVANAGPAAGGSCPACVRDLAGNLIACNKPAPEAADALKSGCCKKTTAAETAAPTARHSKANPSRTPAGPRHKHDSHDDCAGKCQQCCAAPGQAPLVAPGFVVFLDPADSFRAPAVGHAAAPPAGVHISVFHPPRA